MILEDYLHFTDGTASPQSYHVWTFLSIIASVVGHKAWIKTAHFNVFPNIYVLLVSQPGLGKKSTSMDIAMKILGDSTADPYFSNDNQSSQALMQELQQSTTAYNMDGTYHTHASLTVHADELTSLLSQGAAMVDFLTTIYSKYKTFEYKTKNMGAVSLTNPCLNILAGTTTDTFNSRVVRDATAGGLTSRFDIIYDNNVRFASVFDTLTDTQLEAQQRVIDRLDLVKDVWGEFTFTPAAKVRFQKFEHVADAALRNSPAHADYRSRKVVKVMKVSMLLAASELTQVIDETMVKIAIQILDRVEHNMKFVLMSSGVHANADIRSKLMGALSRLNEPINMIQILEQFMSDHSREDIAQALELMVTIKWITVENIEYAGDDGVVTQMVAITEKGKSACMSI